ncbi:hypothetical protein ACQ4PT_027009 [Festuca glaucescens]
MAEKVGAVASGIAGGKEDEIEDMFSHLELNEDELDDVVIGVEEAKEFQKAARWLAIGKVLTTRSFSTDALFEKMKSVWNLSRDPICREAGENLFIFQMHCLGDWKKVVHQGPWTFRGWGLMIEDYDGLSDPENFVFDGMHMWAQIHGIPELYRKVEVVDDLARRVGKVKEVQFSPKLFFEGNYVRIRVRIDVTKPLMRFVSLTIPVEGRRRLPVKYEKIPFFCKRCGLFGHNHEECGDGVWEEKQLHHGSWLLATRRDSQPAPAPRRFVPRAPAQGGWTGKGEQHNVGPRKRTSGDADLEKDEDLQDTAESPLKTNPNTGQVVEDNDTNTRRQLAFGNADSGGVGDVIPPQENTGELSDPPLPPTYVKNKERTKLRKTEPSENILATSAASSEEDCQAQ